MAAVKVGPDLKSTICLAVAAGQSVLLMGHTGIGKTQVIEDTARELKIGCILCNLSLMEPPDLVGMPFIKDGRTVYAPPSFLPGSGAGILFFDELNRAPLQMRQPCLQLLTSRRLNEYKLPRGWVIASACNPEGDGNYDVEPLDDALLARFVLIDVAPDVGEWLKWAEAANVHPAVRRYVSVTPEIFAATRSNPRSWKKVSDVLAEHEKGGHSNLALMNVIQGSVGAVHAAAFVKTLMDPSTAVIPSCTDIVFSYEKIRTEILKANKAGKTDFMSGILFPDAQLFTTSRKFESGQERCRRGQQPYAIL